MYTGEFDTPEVIWSLEHRKQVVSMINQHLGDFPARLRQFTLATYEYCPIAKIHFAKLEKEIYCHEYYLRNLCDEVRFPDWPIADPLTLLREAIEMWRDELAKGVVDVNVTQAKSLLELKDRYTELDLRKAYKNLARKYHPDKNPNGRDMFEKIHLAYELLCSIQLAVCETDMANVVLLISTQNIVYRRFAALVAEQKYPAFPLLIKALAVPPVQPAVTGVQASLLVEGVRLMYYTCSISPLNSLEFVKSGSVKKLYELVKFAIQAEQIEESAKSARDMLVHAMKAMVITSAYEEGRAAISLLCPDFAVDMAHVLTLHQSVPLATEFCILLIAECSATPALQHAFVSAGVVWLLIPMLLAYDDTLGDDVADESQRTLFNQHASNQHACMAARALGRLGGYMFDELATASNLGLRAAMDTLLTVPLAKLLRNKRPWELVLTQY